MSPFVPEMAELVLNRSGFGGRLAVVLGSGLGEFSARLQATTTIPYGVIPHYPQTTVAGHSGELVAGELNGVPLIAARGRFHLYEGHDFHTVSLPVRLFHRLGVDHLIITNAAGSLNRAYPPGTLMAVTGHLDCTFRHGPGEPVIVTGDPYHDPRFITLAREAAGEAEVALETGTYCWTLGPSYETPAEIAYFQRLGGDAVGMSTVPEILTAGELGMRVLTLSCLTNFAAGIGGQPLDHREVLKTTARVEDSFSRLLTAIINRLGVKV